MKSLFTYTFLIRFHSKQLHQLRLCQTLISHIRLRMNKFRSAAGRGVRTPEMCKVTFLIRVNPWTFCGGKGICPLEEEEAENEMRGSGVPSWKLDPLNVYTLPPPPTIGYMKNLTEPRLCTLALLTYIVEFLRKRIQ